MKKKAKKTAKTDYPKAKVSENIQEQLESAVKLIEDACADSRRYFVNEYMLIGSSNIDVDAIVSVMNSLAWAHANAMSRIQNAIRRYEFSVEKKIFDLSQSN